MREITFKQAEKRELSENVRLGSSTMSLCE